MKNTMVKILAVLLVFIAPISLFISCGSDLSDKPSDEIDADVSDNTSVSLSTTDVSQTTAFSTSLPAATTSAVTTAQSTTSASLATTEPPAEISKPKVDLVIFIGQSNMSGHGVASEATVVGEGHGYEFKVYSDPTRLYHLAEPFGKGENIPGKSDTRTGSMVSAFAEAYYAERQVPIVAVSCSQGATGISFWLPDSTALNEAIMRHNTARKWLEDNGYCVENDFMVWCQGETDGANGVDEITYRKGLTSIIKEMTDKTEIEFCGIVRIGNKKGASTALDTIIYAQTELCKDNNKAVLISAKLAGFADENKMKDAWHYIQSAYNEVGADAGKNAAYYVNTGKEPSMYDPEYKNTYSV